MFTGRRAEDVFAVIPGPWTGHDYDALADEVTAFVAESGPPEPLPGAAELIAAAHRHGVPVAVVTSAGPAWTTRAIEGPLALPGSLAAHEKTIIEDALRASGGRVFGPAGAAQRLGIPRSTLESRIRALKINKNRFRTRPAQAS